MKNWLFYDYSNGNYSIHKKFISNSTMKQESKGAKKVTIYKCDELDIDYQLEGINKGQLINTLILKK